MADVAEFAGVVFVILAATFGWKGAHLLFDMLKSKPQDTRSIRAIERRLARLETVCEPATGTQLRLEELEARLDFTEKLLSERTRGGPRTPRVSRLSE